jgi:hypothetical protein
MKARVSIRFDKQRFPLASPLLGLELDYRKDTRQGRRRGGLSPIRNKRSL